MRTRTPEHEHRQRRGGPVTNGQPEPPPDPPRRGGQAESLLTVSAAARLLGVSSSSLRAWAAAGRVPHVRTPGGHRRFDRSELEQWLAERGGQPPAPPQRTGELVPTRLEPLPLTGETLLGSLDQIVQALEDEVRRSGLRKGRSRAARRSRAVDAIEALSDGLTRGDLGPCYRESEWEGFRHGASGQMGDATISEALALRRAVDRTLGDSEAEPAGRRATERALDRMAIRVAAGYAEGVKSRRRAHED